MPDVEQADDAVILRKAILQLSPDELWSPDRLKPLYSLSPIFSEHPWKVRDALYARRREVSREKIVALIYEQPSLQKVFRRSDYDTFSALMAEVPNLLNEYDQLNASPDSILRYSDNKIDSFESLTQEEITAYMRLAELRSLLDKQGFNVLIRDELISVLTDFEFAIRTVIITNEPLNSAECPLLEPTASYLAKPEIQNSYSNRYFAMCFLNRLRIEATSGAKAPRFLKRLSSGAKAHKILTKLIDQFSYLGAPSTCDGRELIEELREVQRLNVEVPSLLFSLFRLILAGV